MTNDAAHTYTPHRTPHPAPAAPTAPPRWERDEEMELRICINIEYIAPILRGAINLQYIVNT